MEEIHNTQNSSSGMLYPVAYFDKLNNATAKRVDLLTKQQLADIFRTHTPLANKQDAQYFMLATLDKSGGRKQDNIQSIPAVVVDIDGAADEQLEYFINTTNETQIQFIAYTTYSQEPNKNHWRIIFLLSSSIRREEFETVKVFREKYTELIRKIADYYQLPIDWNCIKPEQLYALPSCPVSPTEEPVSHESLEGQYVDVLLKEHRISPLKRISTSTSGKDNDFVIAAEIANTVFPDGIMYVPGLDFMIYQNGIWVKACREIVQQQFIDKHLQEFSGKHRLNKIIDCLEVLSFSSTFISRPNYVCLDDVVLDPVGGNMLPQDPNYQFLGKLPISKEALKTAGSPNNFLGFLAQIFDPDPDKGQKILLLQEWFGYSLITSTEHQKMLWLVGRGANGKSVLLKVYEALIGPKNVSYIGLDRLDKPFDRFNLYGKLANIVPDMDALHPVAEGMLKAIVGGDTIYAEAKYKPAFGFTPCARFNIATNAMPHIRDKSNGIFRRMIILEFNRTFHEEEQDKRLVQKLLTELPSILKWALEGLDRLLKNKRFTYVPSSQEAVDLLQEESNSALDYFKNRPVTPSKTDRILKIDLYEDYKRWCSARGQIPVANNQFGQQAKVCEIEDQSSNGKRYYMCRILTDADASALSTLGARQLQRPRTRVAIEEEFD